MKMNISLCFGLLLMGSWVPDGQASVTRSLEALPDGRIQARIAWTLAQVPASGLILQEVFSPGWAVADVVLNGQPYAVKRVEGDSLKVALGGSNPLSATGSVAYVLAPQSAGSTSVSIAGVVRQLQDRQVAEQVMEGSSFFALAPAVSAIRITGFRRLANGQFELEMSSDGAVASWNAEFLELNAAKGSSWVKGVAPVVLAEPLSGDPLLILTEPSQVPGAFFRVSGSPE